jgi:predicted amidohydrolase YtcJ
MEKDVGSIVSGKLANFTILADNPLTVDPMKIKDIGVWGTVHEGRVLPVKRGAPSRVAIADRDSHAAAVGADGELSLVLAARLAELAGHGHGGAHEPR